MTGDFGPGGCLVLSPRPLLRHAPLQLVLRCSELDDALRVTGSVAWTRAADAGVEFARQWFALAARPEAWFRRLLQARPRLAEGLGRVPGRLALDARLYLLPAPRLIPNLGPDEVALLRVAANGMAVQSLLSAAGLVEPRARNALFGLFAKNVLTLALGQASEPWKWRALLGASSPARRPVPPATPATPPAPWPAPASAPAPAPAAAPDETLLRGVSPTRRSPQAQARLDEARREAVAGRLGQAVALLRQSLALAPRDPEISRLLGELAFKDRRPSG